MKTYCDSGIRQSGLMGWSFDDEQSETSFGISVFLPVLGKY